MYNSKPIFLHHSNPACDEELIDLKEELSKHHQLYEDNHALISKMTEEEKKPIINLLKQHKRDFSNNTPKNQEIYRIKFIGNMIKNMVYDNNFEAYLDDFHTKKEKLLYSNKDPDEIRMFLQKKLSKKVHIYQNFSRKIKELSKEGVYLNDVELQIKKMNDVLEKMEAVTFLEKRNEDELITEKHLYENFKQQMQDNFNFLSERMLKEIIEDASDHKAATLKLNIFRTIIDQIPSQIHFSLISSPDDLLAREKARLFYEKNLRVPSKLEEITKKLVNLAKENGINDDISIDNGAYLLYNIENFCRQTYKEQAKTLNFLNFSYKKYENNDEFLILEWDQKFTNSNNFFYSEQTKNADQMFLEKRMQEFKDSLIDSWLNTLLINESNEVTLFIEKKCREYYDQHKKELYLPEIYFEFYKSFIHLSLINSRASLIKILSYLNYFREFERNMKFFVDLTIKPDQNIDKKFPFFNCEFDENDIIYVKKNERRTFFNISLTDFKKEIRFVHNIASFFIQFKQPRIPLSTSFTNIEPPVFDNIDRQELIDEILRLQMRFLLEKTKILRKYQEILPSITNIGILQGFAKISLDLIKSQPKFPLFCEQILNTYSFEINSLESYHEILISLISHQQHCEELLHLTYSSKPLYNLIEELPINEKLYFSYNEVAKLLIELNSSKKVTLDIFKDSPSIDRNAIESLMMKRFLDIWMNLIEGQDVNEFISEYNFLDNDDVLDNYNVYDNYMEFMGKGSLENKTDSPKLKKALQSNALQIKDKLILSLNLIEFIRIRSKIRKFLYSLSFSMKTFKDQQLVFLKDPVKIENIVGISINSSNNLLKNFISFESLKCNFDILHLKNWVIYLINQKKMEEPFLYLQYLFTLDSLTNIYVLMNNFYFHRIKKEFFSYVKNKENFLENAVIAKKLSECSQDFFYDVFVKKKNIAFKILSMKRVSVFSATNNLNLQSNTSSSNQTEKETKVINKNVGYNPFFNKGYKSANAKIINDFTNLLNNEIHYEIMKLNTIFLRNSLEDINNKLPIKQKLFKIVPLLPPKYLQITQSSIKASAFFNPSSKPSSSIKNVVESSMRKSIMGSSKKRFEKDDKGNNVNEVSSQKQLPFNEDLLNIGVLPSLEDIMKYDYNDFPKEIQSIHFEDKSQQENQLLLKISESRAESKNHTVSESINSASGPAKRRTSLLMTPASKLNIFKRDNRKKMLRHKEFRELTDSPVFFLMNCFFHLYNILSNQIFIRTLENSFADLLLFESGLMDEERFKSSNCEKETFEDLKRNVIRISHKLQHVREDLDKIDKNITILQESMMKPDNLGLVSIGKRTNRTVLKYLRTLQRNQYNLILLTLFKEIIQKKNPSHKAKYTDETVLKDFLFSFCFNKIPFMFRTKGTFYVMQNKKKGEKIKGIYNEKSTIMQYLEEVFLNEKVKPDFSLNILKFYGKNNQNLSSLYAAGLNELSLEGRKSFFSIHHQLERILYLRFLSNNEDSFSLESETRAKKALQTNIKYYILKEISMTLHKDLDYIPFNINKSNEDASQSAKYDEIDHKMELFAKMFLKEKKIRVLIDPNNNLPLELSHFFCEEDFIKGKINFLSNEIEKSMINNSIDFYLSMNQILSIFKSNINYNIEIVSENNKIDSSNEDLPSHKENRIEKKQQNSIISTFTSKIVSNSCFIDIHKVGKGIVIPIKKLKNDLGQLNESFINYFLLYFEFNLSSIYSKKNILNFVSQLIKSCNDNQAICTEFVTKNISEIVESKIAKKSTDLLFSLDHLYKFLNYMKDEEALREQEIKKITRNEFSERIVDKKNDINNITSRFDDYKTGMNYDLTKYIGEAKTEAERMIQKRNAYRPSFLTKFKQIFKSSTKDSQDIEENGDSRVKFNDKAKLYKSFRVLRAFYTFRHQVLKEKHERELEQKNQKFISSEILWNKIKDLEKNEMKIKDSLISSEKQIAVLEHQNLVLKRDVRNITLEKVQLYKANNLQRGQILELQENFAVLRKKKFIENQDPEALMKVSTRPMSSANKLLKQQTEMFDLEESPHPNDFRSFSTKKISEFDNEKSDTVQNSKNHRKMRDGDAKRLIKSEKKDFFSVEKKTQWNFKSQLFMKKSFKITNMNFGETASDSNLNFYFKKNEK